MILPGCISIFLRSWILHFNLTTILKTTCRNWLAEIRPFPFWITPKSTLIGRKSSVITGSSETPLKKSGDCCAFWLRSFWLAGFQPIKNLDFRGVANESRLVGKFKRGRGEGENHETSPVFRGEGDRSQIEMQNHRKNEKTPVNFTCIFNFQFSNYFRWFCGKNFDFCGGKF